MHAGPGVITAGCTSCFLITASSWNPLQSHRGLLPKMWMTIPETTQSGPSAMTAPMEAYPWGMPRHHEHQSFWRFPSGRSYQWVTRKIFQVGVCGCLIQARGGGACISWGWTEKRPLLARCRGEIANKNAFWPHQKDLVQGKAVALM